MIDTNALIAVSLSLIGTFAGTVGFPPAEVPRSTSDIARLAIGNPQRATDVSLVDIHTNQWWVRHGIVDGFYTQRSYFTCQDPELVRCFVGPAQWSSNDVVAFTSSIVERLGAGHHPVSGLDRGVTVAPDYNGQSVPFYKVQWSRKGTVGASIVADAEVDARNLTLVSLRLYDPAFHNSAMAAAISNRCGALVAGGSSSTSRARAINVYPPHMRPSTNQVQAGIVSLLSMQRRLKLDLGRCTNISEVSWERSVVYRSRECGTNHPVAQVQFVNGACFECVEGTTYAFFAADACYTGSYGSATRAEWARCEGTVRLGWEELAEGFERLATEGLGLSSSALSSLRRVPYHAPVAVGEFGTVRVQVGWLVWPETADESTELMAIPRKLTCEFDTASGVVKSVRFQPELLGWQGGAAR